MNTLYLTRKRHQWLTVIVIDSTASNLVCCAMSQSFASLNFVKRKKTGYVAYNIQNNMYALTG